jgi:demethylmenaquinone methyltransferase/2-methoxy-6-polyprenyl-1,4-benzoquinol methylase
MLCASAYYRARAAEYDEWFFREGLYDRGPAHRVAWFKEVVHVELALRDALPAGGAILELASGTGLWTRRLVERHAHVVAVDASPEAVAINRARVQSERVEYIEADLFSWTPPEARFDALFFGFWLSHVPASRFDAFWRGVRTALKPSGAVSPWTACGRRSQLATVRRCLPGGIRAAISIRPTEASARGHSTRLEA